MTNQTLAKKQAVIRKLMALKGHARRSAEVSALALIVAAVAATAPDAVAASPTGALAWAAQPPIPTARACLASAVLDGNIYVVGGYNAGEASALGTVEAYDARTKQ